LAKSLARGIRGQGALGIFSVRILFILLKQWVI